MIRRSHLSIEHSLAFTCQKSRPFHGSYVPHTHILIFTVSWRVAPCFGASEDQGAEENRYRAGKTKAFQKSRLLFIVGTAEADISRLEPTLSRHEFTRLQR